MLNPGLLEGTDRSSQGLQNRVGIVRVVWHGSVELDTQPMYDGIGITSPIFAVANGPP